jgi:hypothetical protein
VPRGVVAALVAEALVLAYGGVVQVSQLAGGRPPYPWVAVYFVSLTVLDPSAAWLLLDRRRAGLYLAASLPVGTTASRMAQAVISCLAPGSLVAASRVRPWMRN